MLIRILAILLTASYLLLANPIYATGTGVGTTAGDFGPEAAGLDQIEGMVGNIITAVVGLGFIAMLVLLIFAGLKYLTSGGEPKAIQAAHQTLSWTILGLLFMAVAWLILQLIAGFTGVHVTIFDIKALCGDALKFCK